MEHDILEDAKRWRQGGSELDWQPGLSNAEWPILWANHPYLRDEHGRMLAYELSSPVKNDYKEKTVWHATLDSDPVAVGALAYCMRACNVDAETALRSKLSEAMVQENQELGFYSEETEHD